MWLISQNVLLMHFVFCVDDSGGQPAVTLPQDTTVAEVCRALAKARTDAALLTGPGGEMTGIVTSIDLVRSVRI